MRNKRIQILTESSIAVALCIVLNFVSIRLPINIAGGSISFTMLPIALVALRRGPKAGLITGALFGCIDFLIDPYIVHWAQVFLDYPLPYLLFGFGVGLFSKNYNRAIEEKQGGKASALLVVAMIVGGIMRYFMHLLSGAIFFASYAPAGQNPWLYSAIYQCTYLLPSLIVVTILTLVISPVLMKAVPVSNGGGGVGNKTVSASSTSKAKDGRDSSQ